MPSKELIAQVEQMVWQDRARAVPARSIDIAQEITTAVLASVAQHLDHKAEAARKHAKAFHDKRKSGKYGLKKQTRFYEEGKHYNRLAIGYAKSARAIRALGEQSE
ncbi:hypothetical protein [Brucella tritici]|uniref:hypothetical protein n=1 Tax=Brucella tritici TaxID=94626 RepID=UPI001591C9B3|nr:hypothetical protein [Brucella tritici]